MLAVRKSSFAFFGGLASAVSPLCLLTPMVIMYSSLSAFCVGCVWCIGLAGKQNETERKRYLTMGSTHSKADVYIQKYSIIQALAVDVAVVDGGAPNGIKTKELVKRGKYLVDCANNDVLFKPFVLDSFGIIGDCAMKIVVVLAYSRYDSRRVGEYKIGYIYYITSYESS
jgi:hypothetical protein